MSFLSVYVFIFGLTVLGITVQKIKSSKLSAVKGALEDDYSKTFSKGIEKKELRRTEGISM